MSTAALASDNAYVYLVHGVPGLDYVAGTDREFPVDVLINDEVCYLRGLTFGSIQGPLTFAPGTYDVKISVANALAPCSNSPIVDSTVTLESGKNVAAVFTLCSGGTPKLSTFTNNFSEVSASNGRILFCACSRLARSSGDSGEREYEEALYVFVNPAALLNLTLPSDVHTVEVNEGTTTLVPATTVVLYSQSATLLYAIGEASNNTVTMETKNVRDVI